MGVVVVVWFCCWNAVGEPYPGQISIGIMCVAEGGGGLRRTVSGSSHSVGEMTYPEKEEALEKTAVR